MVVTVGEGVVVDNGGVLILNLVLIRLVVTVVPALV